MVRFIIGSDGKFNLDVSGIAGFFGGEESIAAMASVNLIRYRLVLGWYNSPGVYFVAKKYGIIAGNRVWDGIFPGKNKEPAEILEMDGKSGPRFIGAQSGTRIETTGHLAYLLFSYCTDLKPSSVRDGPSQEQQGNAPQHQSAVQTQALNLNDGAIEMSDFSNRTGPQENSPQIRPQSEDEFNYSLTLVSVLQGDLDRDKDSMTNDLKSITWPHIIAASLTIVASIAFAVVALAVYEDIFCFISILIGIIANGVATLAYGSATLKINMPATIGNAVAGDGILVRENDIVILKGTESKIATITRGKYKLKYPFKPPHHIIGIASFALFVQAISQLVLLPAATLKGQIFFLATFAVSWFHNAHLASVDREKLQFKALRKKLVLANPKEFEKKRFERWAVIVAASTFYLQPAYPGDWLRQLIPNSTRVWDEWRKYIALVTEDIKDKVEGPPNFGLSKESYDWPGDEGAEDRQRLQIHLDDAKAAYDWFKNNRVDRTASS